MLLEGLFSKQPATAKADAAHTPSSGIPLDVKQPPAAALSAIEDKMNRMILEIEEFLENNPVR